MKIDWKSWITVGAFVVILGLLGGIERAGAAPVKWNSSVASVYDGIGLGGRVACKGYWPGGYVVAHKTFRCGTKVRFLHRGRKVTARVWDRGPFIAGREWDLDVAVQRKLGFPFGVAAVQWRVIR